jgi:hypothetical protein
VLCTQNKNDNYEWFNGNDLEKGGHISPSGMSNGPVENFKYLI